MNYMLVVITHGEDPLPLARTMQSFRANVKQVPTRGFIHADGEHAESNAYVTMARNAWTDWECGSSFAPAGFCRSARAAWQHAAFSDVDYVFWLEHDFIFDRGVDLEDLARVLEANEQLAQMQLMRRAVNENEERAGGLFESRPGQYLPRWEHDVAGDPVWHEHQAYFTTNPSLMRRAFMRDHAWPSYPEQCEGMFGIDLVEQGMSFGVWGDGSPWVEHIGTRTGFGY